MPEINESELDPVCGMILERTETPYLSQSEGATFFFCSSECKDKFDADPMTYLKVKAA